MRVVVFVAAIFMMIPGVINLLDTNPTNDTEAIFMVLIGALVAFSMAASFWTSTKRQKAEDDLWSFPGEDEDNA